MSSIDTDIRKACKSLFSSWLLVVVILHPPSKFECPKGTPGAKVQSVDAKREFAGTGEVRRHIVLQAPGQDARVSPVVRGIAGEKIYAGDLRKE